MKESQYDTPVASGAPMTPNLKVFMKRWLRRALRGEVIRRTYVPGRMISDGVVSWAVVGVEGETYLVLGGISSLLRNRYSPVHQVSKP